MEDDKITNKMGQPEEEKHTGIINLNNDEKSNESENSFWQNFRSKKQLFSFVKAVFILIISILLTLALILYCLYIVPDLKELTSGQKSTITVNQDLRKDAAYKKQTSQMVKDIQRLSKKYNSYTSGQSYIVINTTDNRFFLYKNKKLIREGFCSTGSLTMLRTESGNKVWVFKTPKGKRWIQGKITNPSWRRPDWSFVEEGLPIPSKDSPSRYESGVLGDYAMSIGDGYLIHGTIYKRFLGMPVTHGCVRLNDEDLEVIYNTLSIGSKVYIF
jgi:lipoprotein-anchoring transpeptidase ErfK/SrfK